MNNDRITFIIGAGAPLDLNYSENIMLPSTYNITQKVIEPYDDLLEKNNIVKDIYVKLTETMPHAEYECPNINFEQLFHVLEMLYSYVPIWKGMCKNPKMFPPFAPFTERKKTFNYSSMPPLLLDEFILRIMRIVNAYDKDFRDNINEHAWYKRFFSRFDSNSDFFNFNYDTTIEVSIKDYEDGYEPDGIQTDFQRFNPRKLFDNPKNLSTINHLHGCINYYFSTYKNENQDIYTYLFNDLYKYKKIEDVLDKMPSSTRSNSNTQASDSYYPSPIITGLHKTDKLNHIPFYFYHANLVKCIVNSPKLVIIGYGFGDLYCNQLINRMLLMHGEKSRIVLIDKWNIHDILDNRSSLSDDLLMFLCRTMHCAGTQKVFSELFRDNYDDNVINGSASNNINDCGFDFEKVNVLRSKNGCVMVLPHGFKAATTESLDKIENFLNG